MDTIERDIKIVRLTQQVDDALPAPLPTPEEARRRRIASGLSEEAMGALAGGVTPTTVSRWELGKRTPRGETRERYADVLNLLQARLEARSP